MSVIDQIYRNTIGISFFWKKDKNRNVPKIQLVFRDMGFLLTVNELKDFLDTCFLAKKSVCCQQCNYHNDCRSILLSTPSDKVDLAVNKEELDQIQELITGTIFKIELKEWITDIGLN